MKNKLPFLAAAFLTLTTATYGAEADPEGAGTGHYYFLGKIHECLSKNEISYLRDESERSQLLSETSRKSVYAEAIKAVKNIKPQYLDETLDIWLRISARYEEGVDSIRSIYGKDMNLSIDECNLLLPYIRLNIIKKPKDGDVDYPDDGNMDNALKSWEDIK